MPGHVNYEHLVAQCICITFGLLLNTGFKECLLVTVLPKKKKIRSALIHSAALQAT